MFSFEPERMEESRIVQRRVGDSSVGQLPDDVWADTDRCESVSLRRRLQRDDAVTVDELMTMVNVALDGTSVGTRAMGDDEGVDWGHIRTIGIKPVRGFT